MKNRSQYHLLASAINIHFWNIVMSTKNAVREVKNWLMNKCQLAHSDTPYPNDVERSRVPSAGNIVTPYNIPEFIIPGSGASSSRASLTSASQEDMYSDISNDSAKNHRPRSTSAPLDNTIQSVSLSKSAPSSPNRPVAINTVIQKKSWDDVTKALETINKNGARRRLRQSANTRRKESLFHVEGAVDNLENLVCRLGGDTPLMYDSSVISTLSERKSRHSSRHKVNENDSIIPFVKTTLSPQYSSPCTNYIHQDNCLSPFHAHKIEYYRRRSSLVQIEPSLFDNLQSSRSFPSAASNVSVSNKSDNICFLKAPDDKFNPMLKRHSAPSSNEISVLVESIPVPSSSSYTNINVKNQVTPPTDSIECYGEIKISFQYLPASWQLKLTIIKAENLDNLCTPTSLILNTYPKAYLMPGKVQKHTGVIVKRATNPVYNQTFYFDDMLLENINNMKLRIKLFHKYGNFSRREFLGETDVSLDGYDLLEEQRMWLPVNPKSDIEELGYLQVAVTFEPKAQRFQVTVIQIRDLPKHHITGPPDPYIKISVTQNTGPETKKQTAYKRKTTQATFKESFTFYVSPKFEDLRYTTIKFIVYDREPIGSDDVIGHVNLGYRATEDTELFQWNDVIQNPGKEVTAWHYIVREQT